MRIMIVTDEICEECCEIINQMTPSTLSFYLPNKSNWDTFEEDQVKFDAVYSLSPDFILGKKLKIPYFYNVPSGLFKNELNFNYFSRYYSQLSGASAVFVNDKKLNKYCEWMDLNSYLVNEGVAVTKTKFSYKRFITPKLHIGFIGDENTYDLLKDIWPARKSNWTLHIPKKKNFSFSDFSDGSTVFYLGDDYEKEIFENCHIVINAYRGKNNSIENFPSKNSCKAMLSGCVLVSSNLHGNNTNILFDGVHYFKLDFVDKNTLLETLRYIDKRREKLDKMAKKGYNIVKKYFNIKETVIKK